MISSKPTATRDEADLPEDSESQLLTFQSCSDRKTHGDSADRAYHDKRLTLVPRPMQPAS